MNSIITKEFEIGRSDKLEIPRTKSGQKLILKKVHINKIDSTTGADIIPENLRITLEINKWPVLDSYSGTLLSSSPNTTVLNHEFDSNDDIRINVTEIVPTAGTNKILLTMSIEYK